MTRLLFIAVPTGALMLIATVLTFAAWPLNRASRALQGLAMSIIRGE